MKTNTFLLLCFFLLLLADCKKDSCSGDTVKWTNGHCYEAVLAPGLSWQEAKAACEAKGGYLVTITSAKENTFVYSLVSSNNGFWFLDGFGNGLGPWLGGYQQSGSLPEEGWQWVTGESFVYTNWETGQPGDMVGVDQNLLRFFKAGGLKGDRWDDCETDNPEEHRRGYICEYD